MDANQWPLVSLDDDVEKASEEEEVVERKARPQKDCPRCKSTNTKFCYYNNYSLSQPRYFCKTCRRYWTEGGTLRKVPVGGGSRKNKRSTSTNSISLKKKLPCLQPSTNYQNPNKIRGIHDLNLGYEHNQLSCVTPILSFGELGPNPNLSSSSSSCHLSFVGTTMPFCGDATNTVFNPPHPHEYFKLPRFNFCLDGQLDHDQIGNNYGNITSTRVLHHPYEVQRNYKQFTTSVDDQYDEEEEEEEEEEEQNKGQYWGGGSW